MALFSNLTGNSNTASGDGALFTNSGGFNNTAIGYNALLSNTTAGDNAAIGTTSLFNNSTGEFNVAVGSQALYNNISGDSNTAVGDSAGFNITGSGNVCIGAGVNGVAGETTSPAFAICMSRWRLSGQFTSLQTTGSERCLLRGDTRMRSDRRRRPARRSTLLGRSASATKGGGPNARALFWADRGGSGQSKSRTRDFGPRRQTTNRPLRSYQRDVAQ